MRLRLTVRRHTLPETLVIWAIDISTSPTIFNLLEQVNETIPIESDGEWGLDDYSVEVKGSNGVNYECLHFQPLTSVLKDEDEVIIRPLLSRDLKIRRVSGRVQISADGKHLVDGVAWGRPLLRKAGDRPAVNIPPRKRQRIMYNEDDEDPEGFQALKEKEAEDSETDGNRQLVLHADFGDDDEEDDDDFAPGENEDVEDDESEEDLEGDNEVEDAENEEEPSAEPRSGEEETDDANEPALADVKDQVIRAKIRKLHSAFPKSPLAVCKFVLNGSEDIGEAYEAMTRGFIPVKSKSAITEISQEIDQSNLSVPKTRSKAKNPSVHELENLDSMQVEPEESQNALIDYYDQNGLPEGSINSGKALSFMAEALKSSPKRPRSEPRRSASIASNKSVRFALDGSFSNGLTSTPFIDKESQVEEESEEDSDEESDESSDEETSSEDSSDSSDEETNDAAGGNSSSESDSDSESSSESSSDDESPEEASSKQDAPTPATLDNPPPTQDKKPMTVPAAPPGHGTKQTRSRNQRRRDANVLNRLKEKGILPAGTTIAELHNLDINDKSLPETVLTTLETLRVARNSCQISDSPGQASSKADEFELRRQELLKSLASGGIEVDAGSAKITQIWSPAEPAPEIEMVGVEPSVSEVVEPQQVVESQKGVELPVEVRQSDEAQQIVGSQEVTNSFSTVLDHLVPIMHTQSSEMEVEIAKHSTAPESAGAVTSSSSPKPPPTSVASSQSASSRRAKLDLGAGRRLLFGALGIKTPKTKIDEEKVRGDLMKDVRPLLPTKCTEDAEFNPADELANEDPNAWREKINYRAVECVQEGVELSEPPFPFIQRWDPQQRGSSWSQKGNRGGKRKKDQRDQAQYYNDDNQALKKQRRRKGKHNYAEEQEYLNASYEPCYQDDTMTSQFNDYTQAERLQSDVEGEINQQLMNDIQTPAAGYSQGPEDLASLPEDPSTLPDLKDGQAKVGMTIAFKKLELSEATKWQPQVSAYRTAIVIAITDGGELQLNLAMRDRDQASKRYDPETGERVYSKFEVPDDDEIEEVNDDSILTFPFSDLIDPKLVQEPPSNLGGDAAMEEASQAKQLPSFDSVALSHQEEEVDVHAAGLAEEKLEAQFSHVTETPLNSEAPDSNQPDHFMRDLPAESSVDEIPAVTDSIIEPDTPSADVPEFLPIGLDKLAEPISEENRQKIAHMMREAGFRSSVPSSVIRDIRPDGMESPGEAAVFEKLRQDMSEIPSNRPYSPKFNGLGSSSPTRKPRESSNSPERDVREESPRMLPQSSWETVDEPPSSPPQLQVDKTQEEPPAPSSASAVPKLTPPENEKKAPVRKVPVGRAQQLWQALQPRRKSAIPDSAAESSKTSPDPDLGLDGADERNSMASVQYPELSIESSFTSQVADHGRQPDFNYEDSVDLSADTPRGPDLDIDRFSHGAQLDVESESAHSAPPTDVTKGLNSEPPEDPNSDIDPELPFRKLAKNHTSPRHAPNILEVEALSDDALPTIKELVSSQRSMKREQATSALAKSSNKKDAEYQKAMDILDEELSGEDQTTPKAQKQTSVPGRRPIKSRRSEKPAFQTHESVLRASQTCPSQSKAKFEIPQGSQVMDLTMSSDAEPEPLVEEEDSDLAPPRRFKRYDQDEDDDDDEDESGWMRKKNNTIRGVESRRHTSVGLRDSSQASLNTRNRRKTSAG